MKALTLTQPWASLMAMRQKRVETRSWSTTYRGQFVVHASKTFPKWAKENCKKEPFATCLQGLLAQDLPLGRGLCVVRLLGCFPTTESGMVKLKYVMDGSFSKRELEFGNFGEDRFAWATEFVRPLSPPQGVVKGSLGLWDWDEERL